MHDIRIVNAYPSIAINLEHTRSLRIRAEKSPTTKYQLAVYSQDPDDVLVLPLDGCESLEAAQAALRDLVAPQHGCGHAHAHDEWDASPADLRATIDEVEAANEKLETKLANVGKALDAFASAFTRALPAIAEPMRGVLQQFASWLIEARRELGLTEHDLREGFAGLLASVPETNFTEIEALLDRVDSKGNEQTSAVEHEEPEQQSKKPSAAARLATELECQTFRTGWEADVEHAISSWLADVDATKWPRNCKFETHEDAHSRTTRVNTFVDAVSIELLCIVEVVGVPSVMMVYAAETIANVINRLSNMTTLLDYERSRDPHPAYTAASRAAWRCRDYLVIAHKRVKREQP